MKDICETIAEISFLLKKKGFKKQKLKFYEINDQFIKVIQIQKSQYVHAFYINLGIQYFFESTKYTSVPSSYDWHFNFRYIKSEEIRLYLQ